MRSRALLSAAVGLLISGLCLWLAFHTVDFPGMVAGISRVGWGWVLASVVLAYASLVVRAIRWRFLVVSKGSLPLASLLSATFIGMMANNVLPARMGEAVRAWALSQKERVPLSAALASIVVERLLDVIAALAVLGMGLAWSQRLGGDATRMLHQVGFAMLGVVSGGIIAFVAVCRYRERVRRMVEAWAARSSWRWAPRTSSMLASFMEGISGLGGVGRIIGLLALSLIIWAVAIASFQVLADGMDLQVSVIQMSLVFVMVLFGVAIPSAPGFVGTFHGFCVAGLTLISGLEATPAAAYATLLHAAQWIGVTGAGLVCLLSDRALSVPWLSGVWRQDQVPTVECRNTPPAN